MCSGNSLVWNCKWPKSTRCLLFQSFQNCFLYPCIKSKFTCVLTSQRLYKSVYEKNKMKINIVPDMVEMVTAKDSQKKVSEIDYRLHLHEWICHPDLQVNSHVRKVTDQISDVSPLLMKAHPPGPSCPIQRGAYSPTLPQPPPRIAFLYTQSPPNTSLRYTHGPHWNSKVSLETGLCVQCFHGPLGLTA